jgi:purine-binding chemotaxis protein CheW
VLDAVCDVQRFDDGNVKPAPDFHAEANTSYILGLGSIQDRMVILIDIERLLASSELGLIGMPARYQPPRS